MENTPYCGVEKYCNKLYYPDMKWSVYDRFLACFQRLIDDLPHGAQARLADTVGTSKNYINDIYRGRRRAGQDLQEKIAAALGKDLGEMLYEGGQILQKRQDAIDDAQSEEPLPFQDELEKIPERDKETRLAFIYEKAKEACGIKSRSMFFATGTLFRAPFLGGEEYLRGEYSARQAYDLAVAALTELMSDLRK